MIAVNRDHATFLNDVLLRSSDQEVSYSDVGATRAPNLPTGYRHDRLTVTVGRHESAWNRAQDAVRLWKAHEHAGIEITPAGASVEEGNTVLASRRLGPLLIVAPCRIVYTTATEDRFGFGYGTLPGHPEQGEEAFHVIRREDGTVTAEIVAFSRPADLPTRLAGPVARMIQKAVTRLYLQGIADYVRPDD